QTGKSFDELNCKIKNIDTNININIDIDSQQIEDCVFDIFENIEEAEDQFKQKTFEIFEKYLLKLKENIILEQQESIKLFKINVEKSLKLSEQITNMFDMITKYIEKNEEDYKKSDLYNIINGINES